MPKLRNMLGETGTIEIPVPGDDALIVEYRRGVMTPRLQMKLSSLQSVGGEGLARGDSLMTMCDVFSMLIASWNLTDDEGAVLGTDADSLADVDIGILTTIMQRIGAAISPDPLSESGSSNGLQAAASSGPRPITTAS